MTLTEFLEARLAEAEVEARHVIAVAGSDTVGPSPSLTPSRLLREVEARRQIVTQWHDAHKSAILSARGGGDESILGEEYLLDALRALAGVYADHPDYRKEWP